MPPARDHRTTAAELARQSGLILLESLRGFGRNGDLRQASSLAFYTTLALIPAMLLLTYLLGLAMGSSLAAQQKLTDHLASMMPGQADLVLKEVATLTRHPGTAGLINLLVLAWSITPLIAALRQIVLGIFKARETRSIWLTKLLDLAWGMVCLTGLAAIAGAGVLLHVLNASLGSRVPMSLAFALPFGVTIALVAAVLHLSAPRGVHGAHLLAGALTTTALWFLLRPAFTLFLTFNRNYGLAFGSFKSLFIIVIWIYVSMAILLLGAEVAAACHRGEAMTLRRLIEGKWVPGLSGGGQFLLESPRGHVFFREDEPGEQMYYVLEGAVAILKGGCEIARIEPGRFFGEMTFLLGQGRSASAVALEPCRCVVIHARNFDQLLLESPETVRRMLVDMASRLRATTERAVPAGNGV